MVSAVLQTFYTLPMDEVYGGFILGHVLQNEI